MHYYYSKKHQVLEVAAAQIALQGNAICLSTMDEHRTINSYCIIRAQKIVRSIQRAQEFAVVEEAEAAAEICNNSNTEGSHYKATSRAMKRRWP